MSTILTDDERPKLPPTNTVPRDYFTPEQMEAYADAREAAVLAKLAQQTPVAHRYRFGDVWMFDTYRWNGQDADEVVPVYEHPAPQQADRQRVPDGRKLVPVEPTREMISAYVDNAARFQSARSDWAAMLAAAPEAPAQASAVDEREAFEAWVRSKGGAIMTREGVYVSSMTELWWECWQARAALAQKGGAA